jgi:hypothetical protein
MLLEGMTTDPEKLMVVWEWPPSKDEQTYVKELAWSVYLLPEVYSWIVKPVTELVEETKLWTNGRNMNVSVVTRGRSCLPVPNPFPSTGTPGHHIFCLFQSYGKLSVL